MKHIPYGHQQITDEDIDAVVRTLRGDWLTTGPAVREFEEAFASYVGAKYAVSFSNGTAALHGAMHAAGLGHGDSVITTGFTFAATSNSALYVGAMPVFADISQDTLCLDPARAAEAAERVHRAGGRVGAIVPVSYAGYPVDMSGHIETARRFGAVVIEDASHTAGGTRGTAHVGTGADMTTFSFHPVKNMTTMEGGMVTTDNATYAHRLKMFREHGITRDPSEMLHECAGGWDSDMTGLGYNYRLTDVACALGSSQLKRLDANIARRREIADIYRKELTEVDGWTPPPAAEGHAYHLYAARVAPDRRADVFARLRERGIGVQVHYMPVYRHSWYAAHVPHDRATTPITEDTSARVMSLPMYASLTDDEVRHVIDEAKRAIKG